MKTIRKLSLLCLLVLFCLPLLVLPARAATPAVRDDAGLLSTGETAHLTALADGASARLGISVYIATTDTYLEGEDFLAQQGLSNRDDIVLLVVTLDGGIIYYDLYTYGKANRRMSDAEVDRLLDNIYDDMKGGRLEAGLVGYIEEAEAALTLRVGRVLTGSLLAAGAVCLVVLLVVLAKYKMKLRPTNYPLDKYARLKLTVQEDVFTGSFVTKTVISSGSGGGGGGGGGRGGGGGHRGGR